MNASSLFPQKQNQSANAPTNANTKDNTSIRQANKHTVQQGQIKFLELSETMVKPDSIRFKSHPCMPSCVYRWEIDIEKRVKSLNPLLIPMIYGWQRCAAIHSMDGKSRNRKHVYYVAPCGRRLCNINEVDKYTYFTNSQLTLDMFSFDSDVRADREFEANKTYVNIDDMTYGKEDVPISCVNCIDDQPPPTIDYSKVRLALDGVPLNTDESQLEGCDCTDGKYTDMG